MEMQSNEINEIIKALVKAQGSIKHAYKNSQNPFHKSKYADLEGVINTCKPFLTENDLTVIQAPAIIDENECLVTTIYHTSGQWLRSCYKINIPVNAKNTEQARGSAITYARRYCLTSMLMMAQSDDDANEIHERLETITSEIAKTLETRVKCWPKEYQPVAGQEIKKLCGVSKIKEIPDKHFEIVLRRLEEIEKELEIAPMDEEISA